MSNVSREIELIKQQGPTCGIYGIAMIINQLEAGTYPKRKHKQKLANKIFNLAISNNLSEIGELFECSKVELLLGKVNQTILQSTPVNYKTVNFSNAEEMKFLMEKYLRDDYYILFPYYPNSFEMPNKEDLLDKKNKISHWAVLYEIDDNEKVYGRESGNLGKKKNIQDVSYTSLYNSNAWLDRSFSWVKYYFSFITMISMIGRFNIKNSRIFWKDFFILENPFKNIGRLFKNEIQYDLKGKMILIGKGK